MYLSFYHNSESVEIACFSSRFPTFRIYGTGAYLGVDLSFGAALAMVISYVTWRSIGWAIFHGLLNWVYVVYFVLKYGWS